MNITGMERPQSSLSWEKSCVMICTEEEKWQLFFLSPDTKKTEGDTHNILEALPSEIICLKKGGGYISCIVIY